VLTCVGHPASHGSVVFIGGRSATDRMVLSARSIQSYGGGEVC